MTLAMDEKHRLTNIPTELLRALIAVVDERSFTKAGMTLGISQPAVSAQIKRLQVLLSCEVFDRSSHELKLTQQGDMIVSYARRLLSLNDQILRIGGAGPRPELVIRVGTPSDFIASRLPNTLARFRERWPDVRFIVRTGYFDALVRDMHSGSLDLFVGLSMKKLPDARNSWPQEVVWVRGLATDFDPNRPVPLVSYGDPCVYHQLAVKTLKKAGLDWEDVFTGPSMMSLTNAVTAGLGVMPIIRRRAVDLGMIIWEDGALPKLPDLHAGIYVREGGARAAYEQLAEEIVSSLYSEPASRPIAAPVADTERTSAA
jgi:DNA-binding transcriptional LysR family regulator